VNNHISAITAHFRSLWRVISGQFRQVINRLAGQFLPMRCCLCHQLIEDNTTSIALCHCCEQDIVKFDYHAGQYQFNHLLLRPDIQKGIKQPQFDRLYSVAPYQWPYSRWITAIKFNGQFNYATLVAELLRRLIVRHYTLTSDTVISKISTTDSPQQLPQVIIPMPIHRNRLLSRGYNQAQLIAQPIAKALNITLDCQALSRIKATAAQTSLGKKGRKSNVKNAFSYQPTKSYTHVAIIDDVITTGATINEVCKQLKHKGVTQIDVWTICATPIDKEK